MTGSPAAGLVRAWVDLYTRGLPAEHRAARRDEVADDLWCEQEEAATTGRSAGALGADLVLRLLFGMPADITWRLGQRTPVSADTLNRRSSMNTRDLGAVSLIAGLSWALLLIMFVPIGDALWTNGLGGLTILATLIGAFGFVLIPIRLASQLLDRRGALIGVGAVTMLLGAFAAVIGASSWVLIVLLPLGTSILLWEVARTGVVSRVVPAAQAVTAVALAVVGLGGLPLNGGPAERATTALVFAPFVLSWIALGLSLARRVPQRASVGDGSTA